MAADRLLSISSSKATASSGWVLSLLATCGVAIVALVILSAVWAGSESDAAALDRQRQLVNNRLLDQVERVSHEIRLMGAGLSSLLRTFEDENQFRHPPSEFGYREPDKPNPTATFSGIATTLFGYDAAFVVTADGSMPYEKDLNVTRRFKWVRPLLQPLLQDLQSDVLRRASIPDRIAPAQSPNRTALMRLEGRPAVAGVIPVDHDSLADPGHRSSKKQDALYLITFRFLDGVTLDLLSREQGLSGARYARAADPEQDEVAFQIEATSSREPIGFIIWKPDLPGSRVIGSLAPALSVAAVTFLALFLALVISLKRNMKKLSESEFYARHLAHHDVLTGLPNRAMFSERLEQRLVKLDPLTSRFAVALIDLDKFKQVNDEHGHPAGDELLLKVVERITRMIDGGCTLARLGGDEFALLMPDLLLADKCLETCQNIIDALSRPFLLKQETVAVSIGCSIGLVWVSARSSSHGEILRTADVALYEAKSQGRGRLIQYDHAMDLEVLKRNILRKELKAVLQCQQPGSADSGDDIATGELQVFFQGIHSSSSGQLTGAEALVRWQHPGYGLLTPEKFIPVAEESGLINELGSWVLAEALKAAADWPFHFSVAVNVSPSQLRRENFADEVILLLAVLSFDPHRLELEVTEAALLNLDDSASANLKSLRAMGVKIALDDFGTGYSSLSHLINLHVDRIKIDRSFVSLIGSKAEGAAIVSAIVNLGRTLGIATTAEGVETGGQRDFLTAIGCNELQGYLFSKPVPRTEFSRTSGPVQGSALC